MIEDDVDMHYLYRRVFHNLNLDDHLKLFDNAKDALDFLHQAPAETELIFSDINMPVMNGLELRRKIQQDEYLRRKSIPFVFLSTAARPKEVEEAYNLTVQGFFVKASELSEMEKSLELILNYWSKCKHPNAIGI